MSIPCRTSTILVIFCALLALTTAPALAGQSAAKTPAAEAFDDLKSLAGHWQGTSQKGKRVTIDYEVVADGSAVVERFGFVDDESGKGSTETEDDVMLTVYHLDGEELMLTHYCMTGNQPTMRAEALGGDEVRFELSGVTNLATPEAGHMHRAVVRFQGPDRLSTAWTFREDGEDRFTEVIDAERVTRSAARSN
ncbi:MAG: hypothetical protein PVG07_08550 [Acidobacteriota bacterium]